MALLFSTLLQLVFGSRITLHVGVVTQDNVPEWQPGYDTLIKTLPIFKEWLDFKNNVIGNTTVDIVWHMADGQQNTTELRRIGPALVRGTWNDTYYDGTLVTEAYSGSEPPMAPCDVIIIEAWSDIFVSFLEGLEEAGIRVPVYNAGSCGKSVYLNDDGSDKRDFVVTALDLSDKEFSSILYETHLRGAYSVVLLEEANAGVWTASVADSVRTFARNNGMKVIAEKKINFPQCELLHDNRDADVCYAEVFETLAQYLQPLTNEKRPRSYHADIFAFVGNWWMCDDVLYAIHKLKINFKAILFQNWCKDGANTLLKDHPHWVKDFNYIWTTTGFSPKMRGYHFDEGFSSAAIFEEHGFSSPSRFVQKWSEKWGPNDIRLYDYDAAITMAAFYYLWRDIALTGGEKANLIRQFDNYRAPITSYMGLLGSKTGGWNPFHKYLGLQHFPDEDPGTKKGWRIVAPAEYGERFATYPMPIWQDRPCWPKECDACPECSYILRIQWIIYLSFELPLVAVGISLWNLSKRKKFNVFASLGALVSVAVLIFKNLVNFVAMYIMFLRHDAGEIDDISNAVVQCIFTSISIVFTVATIYTTGIIGVYQYQQDRREINHKNKNPNSSRKISVLKKLIVMEYIAELRKLISCVPDLAIAITQFYAIFYMNEVNTAIFLALLSNAYGIGGALKSLAISNNIAECGQLEGIPMKEGVSAKLKVLIALNPTWTAFKFLKAVLIEWTMLKYNNATTLHGDEDPDGRSYSDLMRWEIEEIHLSRSISELESRLSHVGKEIRRMSTKQEIVTTSDQRKSY